MRRRKREKRVRREPEETEGIQKTVDVETQNSSAYKVESTTKYRRRMERTTVYIDKAFAHHPCGDGIDVEKEGDRDRSSQSETRSMTLKRNNRDSIIILTA